MQTLLLDDKKIRQKVKRIAYQVYENNLFSPTLFVGGLRERGAFLSKLISQELSQCGHNIQLIPFQILLDPDASQQVQVKGVDPIQLQNQPLLLVDDVLNTGFTLTQVMAFLFDYKPSSMETAFLAARNHRMFPVKGNYVGIKLATTFEEHLDFDCSEPHDLKLYLR